MKLKSHVDVGTLFRSSDWGFLETPHSLRCRGKEPGWQCEAPVKHIYYLKTYKAASSTLVSMLYRYAWKNKLTIVPVTEIFPNKIDDGFVAEPINGSKGLRYDILSEHMQFDCDAVINFIKPDSKFIASIRHPLAHFKSLVHEFKLKWQFNISDEDPAYYILQNLDRLKEDYRTRLYTKSLQTYQLGLDGDLLDNPEAVHAFINHTEKLFDFVIITEYMAESLVLLRRKFCWQLQDVYYLIQRPGDYVYKKAHYDKETRSKHQEWSAADYSLYHYFVKKLQAQLNSMPQDFWDELAFFKIMNSNIAGFCESVERQLKANASSIYGLLGDWKTGEGKLATTIDPSPWGKAFQVDALDCAFLKFDTRMIRNLLHLLQEREYCAKDREEVSLEMPIRMSAHKARMNSLYCQDWSQAFNAPIRLFAEPAGYMWVY